MNKEKLSCLDKRTILRSIIGNDLFEVLISSRLAGNSVAIPKCDRTYRDKFIREEFIRSVKAGMNSESKLKDIAFKYNISIARVKQITRSVRG